jgi:hypothetical protein
MWQILASPSHSPRRLARDVAVGRHLIRQHSSLHGIRFEQFAGDDNCFNASFYIFRARDRFANDGVGDINSNLALGAGLSDSCAGCHGRPRGSAGSGGDVVTRPDSRDAPHLFGLGLKEMLADEITTDLREIRAEAVAEAHNENHPVTKPLNSKGINFGSITAQRDSTIDVSQVLGVNPDLRVRPFFSHGGKISIREFLVGAFNDEICNRLIPR